MVKMDFEKIWERIKHHEGETFYTIRGCECTYEVHDTYLKLLNTNRSIPKWQLAEAASKKNLTPSSIQSFMAPSYIVAILNDERIRTDF